MIPEGRRPTETSMGRRPTMADIAREAGVSKGAVSYALNGRPGVSDATRRKILAIAERIGFKPNLAARALTGDRPRAIGLAMSRPAQVLGVEPFLTQLLSGVTAELSAHSYALTLQVVADPRAEIAVYERWSGERRVEGVLLVDVRVDDDRVAALRRLPLPAVAVADPGGAGGLPAVWSDEAGAVTEAVEYLYALGHRAIARVSGSPRLRQTAVRGAAFDAVCRRLGLPRAVTAVGDAGQRDGVSARDSGGRRDGGGRSYVRGLDGGHATRRLLSAHPRPTAIVYDNDLMAVAGLAVARHMGVVVPAQLSLVAWDDSPLCRLVHPPLTALSRDIVSFGAGAARRLLTLVADGSAEDYQDVAAHLVPRGSTAPPA